MFGIVNNIAMIGIAGAVGFGGWKHIEAQKAKLDLERAVNSVAVARGELGNCSARLQNILEAADRNATIPDDLTDFVIPPEWLLEPPDGTPGGG